MNCIHVIRVLLCQALTARLVCWRHSWRKSDFDDKNDTNESSAVDDETVAATAFQRGAASCSRLEEETKERKEKKRRARKQISVRAWGIDGY